MPPKSGKSLIFRLERGKIPAMGLLDRLLGHTSEDQSQPDIRFGRYSDSYKETANYEAWEAALERFEKEDFLGCYEAFLNYLRDEDEDNVRWKAEGNGIRFELLQGSKKIIGFADRKKLKVEAKIAKTEAVNVGFMRRLMEQNFSLKYSRYALDPDNNITIVFDTFTLDGSPYKLYYALKEVATNADKQDDLLLEEFKMLQPVDTSHLVPLPEPELEAKYNYIVQSIQTVFDEIDHGPLNKDQYPGGIAYLLLDLVYRLDYLIKPEGYTMETLERLHRLYFSKDNKTTEQKNQLLCRELRKLLDRPKADFFREMYRVTATFGITNPVNHDRVVDFIDGELHHMDWYKDNGHQRIALSVPGYIVGYCMFNYAVPKPDRDFFHLYFRITQHKYFSDLGFSSDYYEPDAEKFNKKAIRKSIESIVTANQKTYQRLDPAIGSLQFQSMADFARSYLLMVRNLDLTRIE